MAVLAVAMARGPRMAYGDCALAMSSSDRDIGQAPLGEMGCTSGQASHLPSDKELTPAGVHSRHQATLEIQKPHATVPSSVGKTVPHGSASDCFGAVGVRDPKAAGSCSCGLGEHSSLPLSEKICSSPRVAARLRLLFIRRFLPFRCESILHIPLSTGRPGTGDTTSASNHSRSGPLRG